MQQPQMRRLEILRRPGRKGMCPVVVIYKLSGGYGDMSTQIDDRANEQQWGLRAPELPLGYPQGAVSQSGSLLSIIERFAARPDVDVAKLQQLLELRERWEKNEARKAYTEAMNVFKLNPPTIVKNKTVSFGNTSYKHASLDNVVEQVTRALSAVGISHRWIAKQEQSISITCVLTHKDGHSEETTLMGPPDKSGSMNPVQAICSTVTYLERYTLMAACGLAAGEDDDGRGATPQVQKPSLPEERITELCEWLANASDKAELHKFWEMSKGEARAAMSGPAMARFAAAKNKRKEELGL